MLAAAVVFFVGCAMFAGLMVFVTWAVTGDVTAPE